MATTEPTGLVLRVVQDEDPLHPRRDCEGLGVMALFHQRYDLGDKDHGLRTSDFSGWEEMEAHIREEHDAAVILPVFMYDHSGLTLSTEPFSCPWDSGQVGFIYISREEARKAFNRKRITKKLLTRLVAALKAEVKTYSQYLEGDVWGYVIEDSEGNQVESCFGFFGRDEAQTEGEHALKALKAEKKDS